MEKATDHISAREASPTVSSSQVRLPFLFCHPLFARFLSLSLSLSLFLSRLLSLALPNPLTPLSPCDPHVSSVSRVRFLKPETDPTAPAAIAIAVMIVGDHRAERPLASPRLLRISL